MKPSRSKPPPTPDARRLTLEIIGTWQRQNSPGGPAGPFLDYLIAKTLAEYPSLSRPDQALLRELTTGVLRWRGRLDYCIGQVANKPIRQLHPLVLDLLRLTAYQPLFLDRIPPGPRWPNRSSWLKRHATAGLDRFCQRRQPHSGREHTKPASS